MYRNTKNVPYYVFGRGSLAQLGDLLKPRREAVDGPVVYFVDHFFRDHELIGRLPMEKGDQLHFVDSSSEPEVTRIDAFKEAVSAADSRTPCCVVGIGGGNALDTAKAVANLLTNPGKAEDYQGWELVKNPAVYKIGIPTLSGTGSECSRTCVLTNIPKNLKLGMNSDYTVYDQLLLDPDLLATVPRDQYFYTGIDTFMHCVESLQGSYRNAIIDAFSVRAVQLCEEIFLSDDMMSEETAKLLHFQQEQVERLSALVRTLLEMSDLRSVPRTDRIDLAPMVEEVLVDLTPLAQKNGITLTQAGENVQLVGSDVLLYRLLFNLTENAIKYNRTGGSVEVSVEREGGQAAIRVRDTGPGIAEEYRDSIFQPFFRVDKSRSRAMGGVGLGLALVQEIVRLHGGTVRVEQSADTGTTILVTLPVGKAA